MKKLEKKLVTLSLNFPCVRTCLRTSEIDRLRMAKKSIENLEKSTSAIIAKNSYSQVFVQNVTNNQTYSCNTVLKEVMITVVPL